MSLSRLFPPAFAKCLPRTRLRGFTAIELLVVIAIAAILVSLALPSFRGVIGRYRVQLATEQMSAAILFARSEAIRRGGNVTLRKRATTTGCDASTTQDWSCGWFVFHDINGDGNFDTGDIELQTAGIPSGVSVMRSVANTSLQRLRFDRWGRAVGASFFGFHFQTLDSVAGATERQLCMSIAGRLRTLTDVPSCPNGF